MGFEQFLFYLFSAVTLVSAGMVVTRRNSVHAVLYLVLTFVTTAVLWMLLEAEFLAIALILVYVGAVMVLFLFVVMMLDVDLTAMRAQYIRYLPLGLVIALVMAVEIFLVVGPTYFGLAEFPRPEPAAAGFSNTEALGMVLYTVFVYPLEIAAIILLVAIVAAIHLTLRRRPETKYQKPERQVRVKKGPDRVRMVDMPSEARVGATATTEVTPK